MSRSTRKRMEPSESGSSLGGSGGWDEGGLVSNINILSYREMGRLVAKMSTHGNMKSMDDVLIFRIPWRRDPKQC